MIFVTVGHQMPYDRLVKAVDQWAERANRADLFAQIGDGLYYPHCFPAVPFLSPTQFQSRLRQASAIVAHAGTGTIIAALQLAKPVLVLPRRADLGETRNDHQFATAKRFAEGGHVLVANDESSISARMEELSTFRPRATLGATASPELIARLRTFIFDP